MASEIQHPISTVAESEYLNESVDGWRFDVRHTVLSVGKHYQESLMERAHRIHHVDYCLH